MSEDLFAGLSTAEGCKRVVSLCDQGHAIHIAAKVCNPPTLTLPYTLTGVGRTMNSLKQGLLPAWCSLEYC